MKWCRLRTLAAGWSFFFYHWVGGDVDGIRLREELKKKTEKHLSVSELGRQAVEKKI